MIKGNIFKIKEGKLEQWKSWCGKISSLYQKEAVETLREEKATQEMFLIFQIKGEYFTIGLAEGECLPATERELNREHRKHSKECLEKMGMVDCLYHIKSDSVR